MTKARAALEECEDTIRQAWLEVEHEDAVLVLRIVSRQIEDAVERLLSADAPSGAGGRW